MNTRPRGNQLEVFSNDLNRKIFHQEHVNSRVPPQLSISLLSSACYT